MNLNEILTAGEIVLREQAHLVRVEEVKATEKGATFLRCTGISPDSQGDYTAKLVVNVFPSVGMLSHLEAVLEANGLLLVFGEFSESDTDYGNKTRSIGNARLALFNSMGSFSLDGATMTGEPNTPVVIGVASKATLKTLETVADRAPMAKTVNLKERHARRTMGATTPDAVPAGATTTV